MNGPIRRLSTVVALLFASLLVATTYIQFVQAPSLNDRGDNRRTLLASYGRERGPILVAGKPVARSVAVDDDLRFQRRYAEPELYSHATGYYSFVYGAGGGVESAEDELLSGSSDKLFYRRMVDLVTGRDVKGASVELTIDPEVQRVADEALGDQQGAVVALDPRTGAILAMVSHPTYDPNLLVNRDTAKVQKAWAQLNDDPTRPLENRAIGGRQYPPGSVFKIVTSAAALSSGKVTPDTQIPAPAELDLPQTSTNLPNDTPGQCGNGKVNLLEALKVSCNTAYGNLGLTLGGDAIADQAAKFGFSDRFGIPMPVTPSTVPTGMDGAQSAQAAIGQFSVRVTPLQVAMISAAVANQGVVMKPYLVKTVRSPELDVVDEGEPKELSRAVDPSVAAELTRMMAAVVEDGTGKRAQIDGITVAGKTGTAQQGKGQPPHAWFTAFAPAPGAPVPADQPQVAVAVVVEDGGRAGNEAAGGRVAAPIAKQVIEAVLGR